MPLVHVKRVQYWTSTFAGDVFCTVTTTLVGSAGCGFGTCNTFDQAEKSPVPPKPVARTL